MWLSADRVVHMIAVPSDSHYLNPLRELISAFSDEQLVTLDEELMEIQWSVADQIDELKYDPEVERKYTDMSIPTNLVTALDWKRVLSSDIKTELELIDLRWRLDVIGIVSQATVDRD
jgi:hypothetical protein